MESPVSVFTSITDLPDEVITLILVNNEPRDIVHFGATCKQFLELISDNEFLWKKKFSKAVPNAVVKLVSERKGGNWHKEVIHFFKLKQTVCMELLSMPPVYNWRTKDVSLTDVGAFFMIATENNLNYYYTIYILQNIVNKGYEIIDNNQCMKPLYTLTTMYYAKIVLRYLFHTYLAMKWLQKHIRIELTPVFVTTFFLQWVDVTRMYSDEEVEQRIQLLITKVEKYLEENNPKTKQPPLTERKKYSERQLLQAISKVIYNENSKVSTAPSSKTLDIVKVIDNNEGDFISYGAIYQAVAKRFGLQCELIAFPNHLFLKWQSVDEANASYTIDLFNGEIKVKRSCPFSQGQMNYEYYPDSLLQFIYSSYMKAKGPIKTCKTQNAVHLWDFFGTNHNINSAYKNFFQHLVKYAQSPAIETTLNMKYLEDVHLEMILVLSRLNESSTENVNRPIVVKRHHKDIKYAVGMICFHKLYNYTCIIRGWEVNGHNLLLQGVDSSRNLQQPFYCVLAGDQSERYVAQENLQKLLVPYRIKNLEDTLAKEFTHFDGFAYLPNEQKLLEYPDEERYVEAFRQTSPKDILHLITPY
ncbi:uncharacterized protein LOC112054851 [Bicyclus anynana]|uniref:Uncharacterized protein LOC112054851 n=1 Tax=Bicyclus anynana TaxID=110368 RepID=A0ABM3LEQ4_BICAN|nr:uncharacterized protein LOC112054851 [Bicyclus anynana]